MAAHFAAQILASATDRRAALRPRCGARYTRRRDSFRPVLDPTHAIARTEAGAACTIRSEWPSEYVPYLSSWGGRAALPLWVPSKGTPRKRVWRRAAQ